MTRRDYRSWIDCAWCGLRERHQARGLCKRCYERALVSGRRDDFEPVNRPGSIVLENWDELRRQGYSIRHAAERLGMSFKALDKAIERGAKRGDPRAVRQVAA